MRASAGVPGVPGEAPSPGPAPGAASAPPEASPDAPAPDPRRRRLRVAIGLVAGLALVAALVAYADPGEVGAALRRADWGLVGLAVLAYAAFFLVRGLRWALLLGPGRTGAGTAALLTAAGWLVSTLVPLKAGDVVRAAWASRRHGATLGAATGTVALERALDVIGLALASSLALLAVYLAGVHVPTLLAEVVAIAWLAPLAGLVLLAVLARAVPPHRRTNAVLRFAGHVLDQLPALARRPGVALPVLALTAAAVAAQSLVYAFLVLAFVPAAPVAAALAGAPLFLLSFGLALTPGHLGTYEAAFVLVYGMLLGDGAGLVAIALAVHLLTASIVTLLGGASFAALWALGSGRSVVPPATSASAPTPPAQAREAGP